MPPQVGFKHHKDYVGYVWAKQEEADFQRQEHEVRKTFMNIHLNESKIILMLLYVLLLLVPPSLLLFLSLPLQVTFTEEELPKGSGDFILGYYSNNMSSIVGVTEPFQVLTMMLSVVVYGQYPVQGPQSGIRYCWKTY